LNTDKLKGKLKERVEENKDKAILSKKLATILLDAPVELKEHELILEEPNKEKILQIFSELEFRTLAKRVLGQEIQNSPKSGQISLFDNTNEPASIPEVEIKEFNTINNTPHTYTLIQNENEIYELANMLLQQKEICFDTETTSLSVIDAELVGISFSFKENTGFYIPIPKEREKAEKILSILQPVFENENILKIGQNIKYDLHILKNYEINVNGTIFDTMLAHYLLQPDKKHGMDYLAETYLNYRPVSIETLIGKKGKNQGNMQDVPPDIIKDYAAEDADITFQLKKIFAPMLIENEAEKLFYQIETPLIPVLTNMEHEGVNIDVDFLKEYSLHLENEILELENSIYQKTETRFNIDSPKQLGEVLFEKLKIEENVKKTKTGQYATGEEILSKLAKKHPLINDILNYRELRKLKNTYVDSLPQMVNTKTKRVHTSFMQTVAATGRLSSNNPNIQNIPIRTEKGKMIRKAFIPRNEEYLLLSADYSQVELRIIAALSNEQNMIADFMSGKDIHAATAANVFNIPLEQVTKEIRAKAKAVNFGIIYGQTAFGLSENLGISRTEAKEIIDAYFIKYPRIKTYMENNIKKAKEKGYVETIMKRKRYLNDINSSNATVRGFAERNAINAPIQGTAADIIKKAMIEIDAELKKLELKTKMILQVHDELVFDLFITEKEIVMNIVKQKMENTVEIGIPLLTEMNTGKNWLEAH
jgi:DNA polymerase-1